MDKIMKFLFTFRDYICYDETSFKFCDHLSGKYERLHFENRGNRL